MLSISFPLGLIVTVAALPLLCVGWPLIRLVRARRKKRIAAQNAPTVAGPPSAAPVTGFGGRVNQQILEQQIDAVFDAMVALIGAERMKLKTLVNHTLDLEMTMPPPIHRRAAADTGAPEAVLAGRETFDDEAEEADLPVGEQVALLAEEGTAPDEIARRLGLSAAEVTLAIKIHAPRHRAIGRRIAAVA